MAPPRRPVLLEYGLDRQLHFLRSSRGPAHIGLLVGVKPWSARLQHFRILHLAITPADPEDQDEGAAAGPQPAKTSAAGKIEIGWMTEHHKQVSRMLPGGVHVIGAFVINEKDNLDTAEENSLKKLLGNIAKTDKDPLAYSNELLLFHVHKSNATMTAKVFDQQQQSLQPADVKSDPLPSKWHKIHGYFLLDLPLAFDDSTAQNLLQEKIEAAVKNLERVVESADFLFDEKSLRSPDEYIDKAVGEKEKSKKGKKGKQQSSDDSMDGGEEFNEYLKNWPVQILLHEDYNPYDNGTVDDVVLLPKAAARLKLAGKMHYCAYVPFEATVGEATHALRRDLLASLRGRIQLHCESLVGDECSGTDATEIPTLHEPPRRILIKLPHSEVCVSDYLYPGETPYESVESVEEVLSYRPNIEDMDDDLELIAGPKTDLTEEDAPTTPGHSSTGEAPARSATAIVDGSASLEEKSPTPFYLLLAMFVALFSIAAYYVYEKYTAPSSIPEDDELPTDNVEEPPINF